MKSLIIHVVTYILCNSKESTSKITKRTGSYLEEASDLLVMTGTQVFLFLLMGKPRVTVGRRGWGSS